MSGDENAANASGPGPFLSAVGSLWAGGFQAIPLLPRSKAAFVRGWEQFSNEAASDETKVGWLEHSDAPFWNVGVACGPASDLCVVDIDTKDPSLASLIEGLLPPTPWRRVGAKGAALAYRFSGLANFQIKEAGGGVLVELISSRKQIVVPPSIHPDTGLAYCANCDLGSVRGELLLLPPGLEGMLRAAIEEAGYRLSVTGHTRVTDWVASGARDVSMIGVAGHYARGVLRGELPFAQAVQQILAWKATCVESVAGDDVDVNKGIQRCADFVIRDVMKVGGGAALPEGWDAGLTPAEITGYGFDVFTELNEKWSATRIKDYARDQFSLHDVGSDGRRQALTFLLDRIAAAKLEPVDEHGILNFIAKVGGFGVTVTVLKKEISARRMNGIEGTDHAQIARAVLERLEEQGQVAFDQGNFWRWGGSHWEPLVRSDLMQTIIEGFGDLPASKKFSDYQAILKTMEQLATKTLRLDDRAGINFANGYLTVDLELLDHAPAFGATHTMPYRYVEGGGAAALRFEAFLRSSWGHDPDYREKVQALREAIAVTLFGVATTFDRCFCLHGPPKTGKSQMLKIISGLVPASVTCAMPPDQWAGRFSLAELAGKTLNLCGELSSKARIDGQIFKSVVSGESMTAQQKNMPLFRLDPRCAHWFATNHIPLTDDPSAGFNRRWLILVFDHIVNDKDREIDLGTRIVAEEREEIVAWAVGAISDVMRRKEFTLPASHIDRMAEVARANNNLRSFILDSQKVFVKEVMGSGPIPTTSEEEIYRAYFAYTVAVGNAKPVSLIFFRQAMRELGSELGFRTVLVTQPTGRQSCVYENLTLAGSASARLVSMK